MTTLSLMGCLYERLPYGPMKKRKSSKAIRDLLYDFNHTIRYTAGYVSYDELRKFLCRKLNLSYGNIPTEQIVPSFLRALFGVGMVKECTALNKKINTSVKSFNDYVNKLTYSVDDYKKFVNNSIRLAPLYVAYFKKVEDSLEVTRSFLAKTTSLTAQEVLMRLQFEEFDKITALHRKAEVPVILYSKLWNKSLKTLFYKDPLFLTRYVKVQRALSEQSHLNAHFYNERRRPLHGVNRGVD